MNASREILNEEFLKPLDLTATAIAKQKCRPKRRGSQVDPSRAERDHEKLGQQLTTKDLTPYQPLIGEPPFTTEVLNTEAQAESFREALQLS